MLEDVDAREKMFQGYQRLRKTLGEPGVTQRAVNEIFNLVIK